MKVLIVVDMQYDFIYGPLGTKEAQAIVPNVAEKVAKYAEMEQGVIIYTRDTHFSSYLETQEGQKLPVPHCIEGTAGWEIIPEVYENFSKVIDKYTFGRHDIAQHVWDTCGAMWPTGGERINIESIELVGVCTDICVVSNALLLKSCFVEEPIIVDSSCCAGVTPEKHAAALEVMRSCQIEVK